jgi:hypothetical protein
MKNMRAGRKQSFWAKLKNKLPRKTNLYTLQAVQRKEIVKRKLKLRRNFLPTLLIIILLWFIVAFIINFVDPYASWALQAFLLSVFLALFFTFTIITSSKRRGFLISFGILLILIFSYFGLGSYFNIILIAGIMITTELFFNRY